MTGPAAEPPGAAGPDPTEPTDGAAAAAVERPAAGNLLSPVELGRRTARCRVLFGPHETNLAQGRAISARHVAYYRERAAGGCGVIVTEEASVHPLDWPYERAPLAAECRPGWAAVASACQPLGALVVAALGHSGGQGTSAWSQRELWAPSDEPEVNTREVPKVMEPEDIAEVVAGFAAAAAGAAEVGLDGVEVNAGQHSLIRQFLSGLTNRRGDGHGADRLRLARDVLGAVRGALGPDPILGLRLSCDEMAPWAGITPEMALDVARELAPLVDYLVVVRGSIFTVAETRPTGHHGTGFNLELAGAVRRAVAVPVVAQGSIVDPDQADEALAAGRCDLVEMTRAQIADPQLVAKRRRRAAPRPCTLCNQWCKVRDNRNPIVSCVAEPRSGHETTDPAPPPDRNGTQAGPTADGAGTPPLLVVGAGPAGLEAARVAALAGRAVRLVEASEETGGMARIFARAPGHQRFALLVDWLTDEAEAAGVELVLGQRADESLVAGWAGPVILATGGIPTPPAYALGDPSMVLRPEAVLAATAAPTGLDGLVPASVAVWDPIGNSVGVAVAELLAWAGRRVTFVTPDPIAGTLLSLTGDLAGANVRLQQAGVVIERRQKLRRVSAGRITVEHAFSNEVRELEAGAVVDCSHRWPDDDLWHRTGGTSGTGGRAVRVGDALAPRTVGDAIREGRAAALALDTWPVAAGSGAGGGR